MVAVIVAAVVVLVVGGCGLVALVRFVARRELAPRAVLVSGDVPPAPGWLPTALRDSSPGPTDSWSWSALEESGVLSGFRGRLRLPTSGVVLVATLQPHTHQATFDSSAPLRVVVELAEFPPRRGLPRLLLGVYPDRAGFGLWVALQRRIRDGARAAGAQARTVRRLRATTVGTLGGLVLTVAVLVAAGTQLPATTDPGADPTPRPTRSALPASATRCDPSTKASKPPKAPTRSASGNQGTGCALAEAVRQAYLGRRGSGTRVTLTGVSRPKTKQKYDLSCTGTTLVTCTGSKILVYLY